MKEGSGRLKRHASYITKKDKLKIDLFFGSVFLVWLAVVIRLIFDYV